MQIGHRHHESHRLHAMNNGDVRELEIGKAQNARSSTVTFTVFAHLLGHAALNMAV